MQLDVLIVGAGLSGMMVAHELEMQNEQRRQLQQPTITYKVVEARSLVGGRLMNDAVHDEIDLGGAWIWPDAQPLVREIVFEGKTASSSTCFAPIRTIEQEPSSMYESTLRIEGGAVQIVRRLSSTIPKENIILNTAVVSCDQLSRDGNSTVPETKKVHVQTQSTVQSSSSSNGDTTSSIYVNHVIFCVPPKLLIQHVTFTPPLSDSKRRAMDRCHTWMAGVTKVSLVYREKFWKENNYVSLFQLGSGLGLRGPAFQVYDASTENINALTAFAVAKRKATVASNKVEQKEDEVLAFQVAEQFAKAWNFFGGSRGGGGDSGVLSLEKLAHSYTSFHVQRWPLEPYISEDPNPSSVNPHPSPVQSLSIPEWDGALLFGGTETDQRSPGVMEGAINAAYRCIDQLARETAN